MKGSGCMAVILAADSGTMASKRPAVLHSVLGRPILEYVVEAAEAVSDYPPMVVISAGAEEASSHPSLDIGHALRTALENQPQAPASILVLTGDTPLLTAEVLQRLTAFRKDKALAAAALYAEQQKGLNGSAVLYCFLAENLLKALQDRLSEKSFKDCDFSEMYESFQAKGYAVGGFALPDAAPLSRVQTRQQLAQAEARMRRRINEKHMEAGVTLLDPERTYIGPQVQIGRDCILYPENHLEGRTILGEDCILYPGSRIADSVLGDGVKIQASVILNSSIGNNTTVGPYAYIRPGSEIGGDVRIGDFVEVKNARVGAGTKISHLSYIGDADLGRDINVGCGVVCVNYDGRRKHRTIIGDGAFIGCNVNLVAPVEVEAEAYIAAGSTITEKVPSKALAIARARQINKAGWKDKRCLEDERSLPDEYTGGSSP